MIDVSGVTCPAAKPSRWRIIFDELGGSGRLGSTLATLYQALPRWYHPPGRDDVRDTRAAVVQWDGGRVGRGCARPARVRQCQCRWELMEPESQIQAVDKADACLLARVAGGGLPGVIGKYGVRRPSRPCRQTLMGRCGFLTVTWGMRGRIRKRCCR